MCRYEIQQRLPSVFYLFIFPVCFSSSTHNHLLADSLLMSGLSLAHSLSSSDVKEIDYITVTLHHILFCAFTCMFFSGPGVLFLFSLADIIRRRTSDQCLFLLLLM